MRNISYVYGTTATIHHREIDSYVSLCNTISTGARSRWLGLLTIFPTLSLAPVGSCPHFFVSGYVSPSIDRNTLYQSPRRHYTGLLTIYKALFRPHGQYQTLHTRYTNRALLITTNRNLPYSNQSRTVTSPTPPHTTLTAYGHYTSRWRSANNMLPDFIIIVQSNIPISSAAPTHYVRFSTHIFLYFFLPNFFGRRALFRGPRGSFPLCSTSPSPATYPHIFSAVSTSFLASFFTVHPSLYFRP